MMLLSWAVRCFLWTSILHFSYQLSFPQICGCYDNDGKVYKLESLKSQDSEKPRFSVNSTKYRGYKYSYNPCSALNIGPTDSGCRGRNVAICWWVLNNTQSADTYRAIGIQYKANCARDDQDNTSFIVYQASEKFPNRTSSVRLKCAEGKKDTPSFEILDEDNWTFQLTHFWDLCSTDYTCKSPPDPEPPSSGVPVVVAGSVGVVFGLTLLIHAVRYCKKQWNANRDNDERQPILGNVEVIDNPVEELSPANQLPSPIGSSQAKPDVNVIRSVRS